MISLIPNVIDKSTAEAIRAACVAEAAWVDTQRGRNGWASYRPEDKPACVPDVPNADKGALIAASPRLIELAEAFVSYLEDDSRSERRRAACLEEARALVAEAKGEK